jgi:hypothetical protein
VIPTIPKNSVTVARSDLVSVLARLDAVTERGGKLAHLVGFAFGAEEPALRLFLPNQPDAANDAIVAEFEGDASVRTAAQLAHIVELVDHMRGETLCIASDDNASAILITIPTDDAMLIVQMPCALPAQSQAAAA